MQLVEASTRPLSSKGGKILSGPFADMDVFNQNGRRYPEGIYETAYEELIPKIQERRLLGELDHPLQYDEIRLSNVSHAITECHAVEEDGVKRYYGTVELLDTPAGMIAQALVKAGINLGISSRGLGSTKQVRDGVEVTSLKLITFDLVAEPSFANAILTPEKSAELSDSLQYIESKLPLNESIETTSVRDQIQRIRESLINKKTDLKDEVDIDRAEIDSLKGLLESANSTIKSDTQRLIESREQIRSLKKELRESNQKLTMLQRNMTKLQDAYNELTESSISQEEVDELNETIIELQKSLAVEKRGMSYSKVSELLEGATTEDEIESRLNSLSSMSRKRQTQVITESRQTKTDIQRKKLSGLASIVSKV